MNAVELRNDLPGGAVLDGLSASRVRALAEAYGIRILTINAIQRFNLDMALDQGYSTDFQGFCQLPVIGLLW